MVTEIKKIGSNLDLKGIVIHQVIKNAGERRTVLKIADHPIDATEKEKLFIGKVNKAYFKKSSPTYGIFGDEEPKFKNYLKQYISDGDFYSFSVNAVNHYKSVIEKIAPATGGFMIFTHFQNTDNKFDYMLILTINNKDGYVVSEKDLTIKDIKNLDLSKVDVASMINLTKWKDIELNLDKDSKTYLSFVKGNKQVSYYFMTFIDCDNKTTSTESTNRLINAIEAYSIEKKFDRDTKIRKRNEIFQYCEECINQKKEIQLSVISALINPEVVESFQEFASTEEYGVSSVISGDKARMKTIKFVTYRDKKMTVEFDYNLLGKDVFYDDKKKELTIKNLPEQLTNQIP